MLVLLRMPALECEIVKKLTRFPIIFKHEKFLEMCRKWVVSNRHSRFAKDTFQSQLKGSFSRRKSRLFPRAGWKLESQEKGVIQWYKEPPERVRVSDYKQYKVWCQAVHDY